MKAVRLGHFLFALLLALVGATCVYVADNARRTDHPMGTP